MAWRSGQPQSDLGKPGYQRHGYPEPGNGYPDRRTAIPRAATVRTATARLLTASPDTALRPARSRMSPVARKGTPG